MNNFSFVLDRSASQTDVILESEIYKETLAFAINGQAVEN